jgi:hypothetical protein
VIEVPGVGVAEVVDRSIAIAVTGSSRVREQHANNLVAHIDILGFGKTTPRLMLLVSRGVGMGSHPTRAPWSITAYGELHMSGDRS